MDAHAWTEVWLAGQGWVRVDPTAFVAPERVEQGMDAITQAQGVAMFGDGAGAQLSYQQYQMLQSLRRLSDQASYYWQKDIVGYDQDSQASSLLKWFNITSVMQQVMWMAAIAILIMSIIIFMIWQRRRKHWHPADQPLIKLSQRLSKSDNTLARFDNEGQLAWLERLTIDSKNNEELSTCLIQVMQQYRQLRYGRLSTLTTTDKAYKQALIQFTNKVKTLL